MFYQGVAHGDVPLSKKAIRSMGRMSRGVESGDDNDECGVRVTRVGEITIARYVLIYIYIYYIIYTYTYINR